MSSDAKQDWGALCAQIPRWQKLARDADAQTMTSFNFEPRMSPVPVRLSVKKGRWVAASGWMLCDEESPHKAYWSLMRALGWHWSGVRWEKWV